MSSPKADKPPRKYNYTKKTGRPTKYTEHTPAKAEQYLKETVEGDLLPTIEDLALYLEVSRETVYAWSNDENKKDFSDIVSRILAAQGSALIQKGLDGSFNPTITKLLLMSKHGYHENNQGNTGVQITINRGGVTVETQGQTLEIEDE